MNISNNITAPCLLIAAILVLILFQSVFFTSGDVLYTETNETSESNELSEPNPQSNFDQATEAGEATESTDHYQDFISYNNIKYKPDRFFILAVISNICAFLLPAVFYVKLKGAGYSKSLKFDMPKLKYLSLSVYMFFVLISGSVLINSLMFYSGGGDANPDGVLPFLIQTGGNPVYDMGVLISFVVLPALCEEFFFRSVLSAEYEKYGVFCAVMITSSAFAISHFSLKFFPSYFFAAAVLYFLAKITNSVLYAVILHAGYNFYSIYLWDKILGVLKFEQNRVIFIFITAVIFMAFIAFTLNTLERIYYKKAYNNDPSPVNLPENKQKNAAVIRFFKSFLSPTFIAVIIIFFIYINI